MASLRRIHGATLLALVCCLLLAGCGKSRHRGGDQPKEPSGDGPKGNPLRTKLANQVNANDLLQIGLAYQNLATTNKAPARAEDLAPYFENSKRLLDQLKSGDIVFYYGVRPATISTGMSRTVLAYEKKVPTEGGWVLMASGSVKQMTADEFNKAPKAKITRP